MLKTTTVFRFSRRAFLVCGAAMAVAAPAAAAEPPLTIVFGTYTPDRPTAMVDQLSPMMAVLAREVGERLGRETRVRMQIVKSYEDGIAMLTENRADFMRVGPVSYVLAKEKSTGVRVLALESNKGKTTFNGIIAVRADSPVRSLADLRGRSFAFGDANSTLGRHFAQVALMNVGIFAGDLSRFEYLGRHDKVGAAVDAGLYDAGALEETIFRKLVNEGAKIRSIAVYPNATRPWIARAGLDERLFVALRLALFDIRDSEALAALRFDGFLPGDDSDYEPTRQALERSPKFAAARH